MMMKPDHRIKTAMLAGIALFMAGCASSSDNGDTTARSDPYESANRSVFAFNLAIDDYALEPAAKALRASPNAVQMGLRNHVDWVSMPKTALNSALQGKAENAAIATLNFAINSLTFGFADLLEGEGRPEREDFGQTLASAGVEEGPYVVAPFLGGQTGRALAGWGVDFILNPYGQLTEGVPAAVSNASIPISATSIRATYFDAINDVKYNSLDPYARARSAYYQQRDGLLRNNLPIDETSSDFGSFFE
jgi:phospholipid-binding lipoprotein MlaA